MYPIEKNTPGDRIFRPPRTRPLRIILPRPEKIHNTPPSFMLVVLGFAIIIFTGAVLLALPVSSQTGEFTSPVDALFTATSAVCVTGLAVLETGNYWSLFGQVVIMLLIQIGGMGIMTVATLFLMVMRRHIGLREKMLTTQSLGLEIYGGFSGLVRHIAEFSLTAELLGGIALYFRFRIHDPQGTAASAAWEAAFHAVSAFNNCGFDILGGFDSLIAYQKDPVILLVIASLIILGGIGFFTIEDLLHKRRFVRLTTDTKIVLSMTGTLLLIGTLFFLIVEHSNPQTLGPLPWPYKILVSFFQSVTPRTAGFTAVNIGHMTIESLFFIMLLMFIGGASGSTAGGIKVNTFGMLMFTAISTLKGSERPHAFNREFVGEQINRGITLILIYITIVSMVTIALSITETQNLIDLIFESFSAMGTVGLTTGITPNLSTAGRIIIICTMFIGRLGPLSLASIMVERQQKSSFKYPKTLIRIG